MSPTLHMLVTLVICTGVVSPLARARWVWRAPRISIALWQMLAASWVLCAVGTLLAIGLSVYGSDIPTALSSWGGDIFERDQLASHSGFHGVVTALGFALAVVVLLAAVSTWVAVWRTRHRHRRLLALVAHEDPAAPGALIVDYPVAVAYCLPGLRAQVVLSAGAVRTLTPDQIAAVLAHERTHARERHDLVLLPFAALRRLVPRSRLVALAAESLALLVEMRADESACRHQCPRSLASALSWFHENAASPPVGTLGMGDAAVAARLLRISSATVPLPVTLRWLALLTGLVLISTPLTFLLV
ncbi:MAG: M56 family metallopeptidase [Pseudonocardiaceae bacterium]